MIPERLRPWTDAVASLAILVAFIIYMVIIIVSHSTPLSSDWKDFGYLGWVLLALLILRQVRDGRRPRRASRILFPLLFLLVFPVAATTLVASLVGTHSTLCSSGARCSYSVEWYMDDGYFWRDPGGGDSTPAWVPASEEEYVAKAGMQIRQRAVFGVISFTFAFLASEGTRFSRARARDAEAAGEETNA